MTPAPLTEEQKTELANDIRTQMRELDRKLEALGIPPELPPKGRNLKEPDGGPVSTFRPNATLVPTVEVTMKNLPGNPRAIINQSDFQADEHEKVEKPKRPRGELETPSKPLVKPQLGTQTRDQLLVLTVPALKELPEVKYIKGVVPENKQELVEAILAVRAQAHA